jgi:uncharacterized membrane protein (UPF0182 family)
VTRGRWVALALALAALLLLGRTVAELVVERRWYAAFGPGALEVWRARESALWLLRGTCAVVAAAVCFANLAGVVSSVENVVLPRRVGGLEIGETVEGRRLLWGAAAISVAVGSLLSLPLDAWEPVVALSSPAGFGEIEPYTSHDLAYHVHWLPLEHALYAWALFSLLAIGALVLACYALTPGLRVSRGRVRLSGHVRRHVTVLGVGLLLLLAWGHRLDAFALLTSGSGDAGMFTLTDHRVGLPLRFGLGVATALAALVVLRAGWAGQPRLAFWVVTVILVGTFVARWLGPALYVRSTAPELRARLQGAYAATRALYTRRAYAADEVLAAPAAYGADSLTGLSGRVSVWDPAVLAQAIDRARSGGTVRGEIGWAGDAAGRLRAVAVESPDGGTGEDAQPEWTALTLDASAADADGMPSAVTTDARPLSDAGRRFAVLIFPEAQGPAVVSGASTGVVGDDVDDWGIRLAHAWARRDLRFAVSSDLDRDPAPRLVLRREPLERLQALVPFFTLGETIHPAIAGDSLHWVVHMYAGSAYYPLSQRRIVGGREQSYFQHAGVAFVNAQSGAVRLVADSAPGALAGVWIRRFSMLFTSAAQLPPALAAAIPPATDGVLAQASAFAQFGGRGTAGVSPRRLAPDDGDSTQSTAARAVSLLPFPPDSTGTADSPPLVPAWTLPLLDTASRLEGVLVALGGPTPRTRWVPLVGARPRWADVREQLRDPARSIGAVPSAGGDSLAVPADSLLAPALDSAGVAEPRGLGALRGQLRVLPVRGGIVFVQPSYGRAGDGSPVLAGVVVASGDSTRVAPSLAAALGGSGPTAADGGSRGDRLARARALYDGMRQALRRGDWNAFGRALDSLGAAVGAPP